MGFTFTPRYSSFQFSNPTTLGLKLSGSPGHTRIYMCFLMSVALILGNGIVLSVFPFWLTLYKTSSSMDPMPAGEPFRVERFQLVMVLDQIVLALLYSEKPTLSIGGVPLPIRYHGSHLRGDATLPNKCHQAFARFVATHVIVFTYIMLFPVRRFYELLCFVTS